MAIADFILGAMKRLVIPVPTKEKLSYYHDLPNVSTRPAGALDSKSPRELDLIVYGATGFTGKLLTRYLAKTYKGTSLKWAIAGRSKARLEEVRDSLGPDWKDLKIVVADGLDADAVTSMVRRTKCVATTAGPFALHANQLVASCAVQGTDYCDITGEVDWVRVITDKYDALARESGARIINMCGHDCVPWELSVRSSPSLPPFLYSLLLSFLSCMHA
jgi:short subunit dehydrogenase-like uncharacterized protein